MYGYLEQIPDYMYDFVDSFFEFRDPDTGEIVLLYDESDPDPDPDLE